MNFFAQMMFQTHRAIVSPTPRDAPHNDSNLPNLTPGRAQFREVLLRKWRSANQVADAVGHTTQAVRVELRRLEAEGMAKRRTSTTKKGKNGQPVIEFTWTDARMPTKVVK